MQVDANNMLLGCKEHLEGQSLDLDRRGAPFYVIVVYRFTWNSQIALVGLLCLGTKCENQFHPSYPAFPSLAPKLSVRHQRCVGLPFHSHHHCISSAGKELRGARLLEQVSIAAVEKYVLKDLEF